MVELSPLARVFHAATLSGDTTPLRTEGVCQSAPFLVVAELVDYYREQIDEMACLLSYQRACVRRLTAELDAARRMRTVEQTERDEARAEVERLTAKLTEARADVVNEVNAERQRQDVKWGEQNHAPDRWMTILGEEFGEACQAALNLFPAGGAVDSYRRELVQVAAVAVAALESLDRWTARQEAMTERSSR